MIKDEFEELLNSISKGFDDNQRKNADDIILRTYRFFSHLKEELKTATGSEKDELLEMVKTMQQKVNEYAKKSCEKVGLSESELIRLSDDSDIFSPDQKRVLDMAKKEMLASSKIIRSHLHDKEIDHKAVDLESPKKKKKPRKKRSKRRDDWMKS